MSVFRRRVDIIAHPGNGTGEVRAALEDDFHHFRVWVCHHQGEVTAIGGEALRYPYSLCPQACDQLQHLVGMKLDRIAHSVTRQTDASHQCTHLLDSRASLSRRPLEAPTSAVMTSTSASVLPITLALRCCATALKS